MKRIVIFSLGFIVSAILAAAWWLQQDMDEYLHTPVQLPGITLSYSVQNGTSFQSLLDDLQSKGIITKPWYLDYVARKSGRANKIKAGEYLLHQQMTPLDLLDLLVSGRVIQYSLTLIEGWTFRQVMEAISHHPHLVSTLEDASTQTVLTALDLPESSAEGLFLPETYHFPAVTTDIEFLGRAYQTLMQVLNEEWETRKQGLPYKTPYEALIMASLIEKETAKASERAKIAGVFVRRLKKNMKLQTDPTVIYAMGVNYNGNIRKKDLFIDSPYNTYRYKGLPPTPIALVGREAIHAALHPEQGTALYFVSRGDGSHYFSETLSEHNKAVLKYQLKRGR